MDVRSFKLNFELNLMVYGKALASQVEKQIRSDLEKSDPIVLDIFLKRPNREVILENFCRLFSPIL